MYSQGFFILRNAFAAAEASHWTLPGSFRRFPRPPRRYCPLYPRTPFPFFVNLGLDFWPIRHRSSRVL